MLFLNKFWKGDASPGERRYQPHSEYAKAYQTMERCDQYMKEHLDPEALKVFEEFVNAGMEVGCLSDCDNFIDGFRMGAKMMMDVPMSALATNNCLPTREIVALPMILRLTDQSAS